MKIAEIFGGFDSETKDAPIAAIIGSSVLLVDPPKMVWQSYFAFLHLSYEKVRAQ